MKPIRSKCPSCEEHVEFVRIETMLGRMGKSALRAVGVLLVASVLGVGWIAIKLGVT